MKPRGNRFTQAGEKLPKGKYEYEVLGEVDLGDGRKSMVRLFVVAERQERAVLLARRMFMKKNVNFTVERNTGEIFRG